MKSANFKNYTYQDVAFALDNAKKPIAFTAKELGRTSAAITSLRYFASLYQRDAEASLVSGALKQHFKAYFQLNGKMQERDITVHPVETKVRGVLKDQCETQLADIEMSLEKGLEYFKQRLGQYVELSAAHQNHLLKQKCEELERTNKELTQFKTDTEKELRDLRTLRENAQKSNFGSMLRKLNPNRTQPPVRQ